MSLLYTNKLQNTFVYLFTFSNHNPISPRNNNNFLEFPIGRLGACS